MSLPTTTACSINTIGHLLRQSKYTIMLALDPVLTYEEVGIFFERVSNQCAPKPSRVLHLLRATDTITNEKGGREIEQSADDTDCVSFGNQMRQLPTSLSSLDRILGGGVRLDTVTELVGRSGVGKTQLAFQLCITAAKFNQGAIYIDTEKKLSLERLREMSEQRRMQNNIQQISHQQSRLIQRNQDAIGTFKPGEVVLDNLTVHQPGNSEELLAMLDELEYEILIRNQKAGGAISKSGAFAYVDNNKEGNVIARGKHPVRLLIVDSIAAPIRRDFGSGSAPQRAAVVFQCAQKLKRLADQFHMAVVVINQVSHDARTNNCASSSSAEYHHVRPVRAALGTSWHHCVSTRLSLETKTVDPIGPKLQSFDNKDNSNESSYRQRTAQASSSVIRKIAITKSNKTEYGETHFNITTMGVVEV